MLAAEQRYQRKVTAAFIAADAESVVLQRSTRLPDGAGGWKWSDPPTLLPPQRVRLIPSTSSRQVEQNSPDGSVLKPSFTLLGEHDLDVENGDRFVCWGYEHVVVHVLERTAYSVKADVVRHGT